MTARDALEDEAGSGSLDPCEPRRLGEEPAVDDGQREVRKGLSLDDEGVVDVVVTQGQAADGELDVRVLFEGFGDSGVAFSVVNGNSSDELRWRVGRASFIAAIRFANRSGSLCSPVSSEQSYFPMLNRLPPAQRAHRSLRTARFRPDPPKLGGQSQPGAGDLAGSRWRMGGQARSTRQPSPARQPPRHLSPLEALW